MDTVADYVKRIKAEFSEQIKYLCIYFNTDHNVIFLKQICLLVKFKLNFMFCSE